MHTLIAKNSDTASKLILPEGKHNYIGTHPPRPNGYTVDGRGNRVSPATALPRVPPSDSGRSSASIPVTKTYHQGPGYHPGAQGRRRGLWQILNLFHSLTDAGGLWRLSAPSGSGTPQINANHSSEGAIAAGMSPVECGAHSPVRVNAFQGSRCLGSNVKVSAEI